MGGMEEGGGRLNYFDNNLQIEKGKWPILIELKKMMILG